MRLYPLYSNQLLLTTSSPTFAALSLGTGELTCGSINRATGSLTLEIGGTAEITISSTTITFGGNLLIPDAGYIGSASDTTALQIEADGDILLSSQLGIGITPGAQLEISKDSANATLILSCYHDTEATTPLITMRKGEGTAASHASCVDDDAVQGTILFQAYDGNSWANGAKIEARVQGAPSDGDMPTELSFWTTPDVSETLTQRMTILANGRVGINNLAPVGGRLDVLESGTADIHAETVHAAYFGGPNVALGEVSGTIRIGSNSALVADAGGSIAFTARCNTASAACQALAIIKAGKTTAVSAQRSGYLVFHTRNASNSMAEHMRIDEDGNIGMSCLDPAGTLSIGNVTEGKTASLNIQTAHETHTLAGAGTSVTTTLDIPTTALVLGAAFCVNTEVADDDGNDTWSAAFSGGDASAIVAAVAKTQNTKAHSTVVPALTNAETEITFTPNGSNFTAGVIEVVAWYIDLTDLANV